jgi:hypothetical protein
VEDAVIALCEAGDEPVGVASHRLHHLICVRTAASSISKQFSVQ